jgi:hypothetical protein
MAQFQHPELGGGGQWMRGGMVMVGDMFNHALKAKVDSLCTELSDRLMNEPLFAMPSQYQSQSQSSGGEGQVSLFVPGQGGGSGEWWPAGLGAPSSTGAQNQVRYAFFPGTRRLAVEIDGRVTIYDTGDHLISGVSQQQGGGTSVTFTSQYGLVRVADLPVVSGEGAGRGGDAHGQVGGGYATSWDRSGQATEGDDVFSKLERLAELQKKGVLTDEEFAAKKAELLAKL